MPRGQASRSVTDSSAETLESSSIYVTKEEADAIAKRAVQAAVNALSADQNVTITNTRT